MDVPISSPSPADLDSRVISGWAAIEHGDIEEARAALRDVYSVNPSHPALPLLAANIRRVRPTPVPWRGIVLLLALIAVGALAWRWSSRARAVPTTAAISRSETPPPRTEESPATAAATSADATGTSGQREQAPLASPTPPSPTHAVADDETQIRQAIARFTAAYSNRWAPLTFSSCAVSRSADTANVECQSRPAEGSATAESGGAWVFACRKIGDAWKITSMSPPADLPQN
jgi:hypothetical protein